MKKIVVITLMLAMAAPFGGVSPAFADSSTDPLCSADAPEGYKRPGGYCDQIDSKGSLMEDKDGCDYRMPVAMLLSDQQRVLVADNCYPLEKVLVL